LSRGAQTVIFIDSDPQCVKIINKNISKLKIENRAVIINENYKQAIKKIGRQDVIYLDPPFNKDIGSECLDLIVKYDILNPNGIVILEHDSKENIPERIQDLFLYDKRIYGKCAISFFRKGGNEDIYISREL